MNYIIAYSQELKYNVRNEYGNGTWGKDNICITWRNPKEHDLKDIKQFIKLQGFWFRPDIISGRGKHNFHSMNSTFWGIDSIELEKYGDMKRTVILKPDTPFSIIQFICKYEDSAYKYHHTDWKDKEQDIPIRLNNWETTHKELYEMVKPWMSEDQSIEGLLNE